MNLAPLRTRWQGLAPRERRMVLAAAACVVAALVYAIGIEPAWRDRARLLRELPDLQSQAAQVDALRQHALALRAQGAGADPPGEWKALAGQSLARANVAGRVEATPAGGIAVAAKDVAAQPWFAWVEGFARESRFRVVRLRVVRATALGRVDAEAVFAPAGR